MLRDLKNNGFASVVEIIVTSVIFIITAAGILSTIGLFRPAGQSSAQQIEAAYVGKGIIDDFRQQVAAGTLGGAWDDPASNLSVGGPRIITDGIYTINYTITQPTPEYRHLAMNVTWPDP